MLRKTEEIRHVLAAIVVEKNEGRGRQEGEAARLSHGTAPASLKSNKKEQAEDAYRSIFMKTLKARK